MRSLYNFIIEPIKGRYNNTKEVDGDSIIINTQIQNHEFTSRRAIVIESPILEKTDIKAGDEVIVHHNVFRRMYNVHGDEVNSKSYYKEDQYFVFSDQIFMYKRPGGDWKPLKGFCFVKPIANDDNWETSNEKQNIGEVVYPNSDMIKNGITKGSIIGFTPDSEYEFIIDDQRLYRVTYKSICIIYGRKGKEKEYHRSGV